MGELKTRDVIEFCVNLGKTQMETLETQASAKGKTSVCRSLIYIWHERYRKQSFPEPNEY